MPDINTKEKAQNLLAWIYQQSEQLKQVLKNCSSRMDKKAKSTRNFSNELKKQNSNHFFG